LFLLVGVCTVEHMFDTKRTSVELPAGEVDTASIWCDDDFEDLVFLITVDEMSTGWVDGNRHQLPDLELMSPGPFLMAVLFSVDRSRLNGFDLVRVLRARERLVAHCQAGSARDVFELAHAVPGSADSVPDRLDVPSEFAADELRPALNMTRRAAQARLSVAFDLCERLPKVWDMLDQGLIDLPRARVVADGTAHLEWDEARQVAETVSERGPRLTTGQLAAWIRRLCVETDPEQARKRRDRALDDRKLALEPTVDGTADVHLYDIPIADARAIGKRVNARMISLQRDGDTRSHDQLRADIAVDLLLGSDPTNGGRGLLDIRVDMATLAGLDDKAADIPGIGPVIAGVAREFADRHPKAEWQATVCDQNGDVVDVITTSRRPTRQLSRLVDADQPVCAFPGCRMPARDCDYDHLLPASQGGPTSRRNGWPKCRHDHRLKDNGWQHQRVQGENHWTSPLGHTYKTEKPP
jgi:hypothetical protein